MTRRRRPTPEQQQIADQLRDHGHACTCHRCCDDRPILLKAGLWRLCYAPGELEIVRPAT